MEEENRELSEDSVQQLEDPPPTERPSPSRELGPLYWACVYNDPTKLQAALDRGVSPEEATQVDRNGRTGLMVACYKGFDRIVVLLSHCPFLDVNQQDKEGNTALMLAAQAGHITLVNYLLNYYPGLDLDRRDGRGLTALMKASVRGCSDCVTALLMSGADLTAVDPARGKTALEWAALTDSFETVVRIRQLIRHPRVEQLSPHYALEWPALAGLVAQAQSNPTPSFLERLQSAFSFSFPQSPQEGGVLDHLVRVTTSLASPFIITACHTLCPDLPPELGMLRPSVPELQGTVPLQPQTPSVSPPPSSPRLLVPSQRPSGAFSLCPSWLLARESSPSNTQIPKIRFTKVKSQFHQQRQNSIPKGHQGLVPPSWHYQKLREERKLAEERD
ncbi:photoreceptor ankyrin repeat protein [Antechinus flavipes]|uniref:photoreceptor ankyrin repeat protein n=1 Tax=Antechinus flavipes TaxID=38775 RepID=UPI002235C93D|nr:photoreceptor ankyrin repeat protein [Antechinus flavipes]